MNDISSVDSATVKILFLFLRTEKTFLYRDAIFCTYIGIIKRKDTKSKFLK